MAVSVTGRKRKRWLLLANARKARVIVPSRLGPAAAKRMPTPPVWVR